MNHIEFLGTSGTKTSTEGTTCLRVSKTCVIDAGNLIEGIGKEVFLIDHIFLTHSHLDHIIDIAFLADQFVTQKKSSLKIYGLKQTLDNLRNFIFNNHIWPNFEEINLVQNGAKSIEFIDIFTDQPYSIDDIILTPFKTNHTEGSCGYIIEKNGNGILFTSDTYQCKRIWELMEERTYIHSLVIDVSFPSSCKELASNSKHLTPQLLAQELAACKRQDFKVFPMHLKKLFETTIKNELRTLKILDRGGHVLKSHECLYYDPNTLIESCNRIRLKTTVMNWIKKMVLTKWGK